jgi:phosphocarrier protein
MNAPVRGEAEITNAYGLHLRAAQRFVVEARRFRADVRVSSNGRTVDGKSILDLMTLAAGCGVRIAIEADGPDAAEAVDALTGFITNELSRMDGPA